MVLVGLVECLSVMVVFEKVVVLILFRLVAVFESGKTKVVHFEMLEVIIQSI